MKDSSNAFMDWRTRVLPPQGDDAGLAADLPARSRWSQIFHELRFYTHQLSQPARCCRYSIGTRAELRMEDGTTREITTRFREGEQAAALGFEFEMDAIRARVATAGRVGPSSRDGECATRAVFPLALDGGR